jgi:hypothetical protein
MKNVDGSEVTLVWSSGIVYFLWETPAGEVVPFNLPGSKTVGPKERDKRYISFNQHGISMCDSNSNTLLRRHYQN